MELNQVRKDLRQLEDDITKLAVFTYNRCKFFEDEEYREYLSNIIESVANLHSSLK